MDHYLTRLQNATRKYWNKSALNTLGGESFTYSQMATLIEKFHIFFDKAGLQKGQHIALWARNSARWGMSYLAVNTYEAVIVPILADFTPESVESLVNHSDSIALLTNADKWAKLDIAKMPEVKVVMDVDNLKILYCRKPEIEAIWNNIDNLLAEKYPDGFGPEDVVYPTDNWDDLAVINYTSGSTGNPKGVMLTYRNFSATIEFSQVHRPTSDKNRMISMLPMAHMYGLVTEFIYPLCNGTSIYWLGKTPTPSTLMKAFQEVKPYQLITVPLVMEKIFKSKIKPMLDKPMIKFLTKVPGVNRIIFNKIREGLINAFGGEVGEFIMGGAPVNPEIEKWFQKIRLPYTVGYGMTEATPLLAYAGSAEYVAGSCGKPVDCATVRIDSDDPQHIVGEIQAKGDNICLGYYKNPEASANAFTEDGFLRTGDLGLFDADGNLYIKGRSKSMILSANGQNIYPEELESVINSFAYVVDSLVIEDNGGLTALVYPDYHQGELDGMNRDDLEKTLTSQLPEINREIPNYAQIKKIEFMPEDFERTPKKSIKRYLYQRNK